MSVRASGVLLHLSSLPSRFGIGDMGPAAYEFATVLAEAKQLYWQFLPLSPTSPAIGNSPYSSPSAFAGNSILISPELLVQDDFVSLADLEASLQGLDFNFQAPNLSPNPTPEHTANRIDFDLVHAQRAKLLSIAYEKNKHKLADNFEFQAFCKQEAYWLEDYALFCALKEYNKGAEWRFWVHPFKYRDQAALQKWSSEHHEALEQLRFVQFLFHKQWFALRKHCSSLGLRLVGDLPIYVTYDSVDVWSNPQNFKLDENLESFCVAGVPPDYFSATGQRWGNPVYHWDNLAKTGYDWWIKRIAHNLQMFDTIRIDHFRGFAGYWEIDAAEETAINGAWVAAPGMDLFKAISRNINCLPIIAEDLGVITADVRELRDTFNLPGMKILQFAFGGDLLENPHIPFNYVNNSVVYTGTHDNAPTKDWFMNIASYDEKKQLSAYVGCEVNEYNVHEVLMRLAMASVASLVIVPMQDVLALRVEGRMNTPSTVNGNWSWRMSAEHLHPKNYEVLAWMTKFFART